MSSPSVTIVEGAKENNQINSNIGVGSIVKAKVGNTEEDTREIKIRSTSKYVVGCVQDVVV